MDRFFIKDIVADLYYRAGNHPVIRNRMRPFRGKAAILAYHQVLPTDHPTNYLKYNPSSVVTAARFEEQMKYLSGRYQMISMDDLLAYLSSEESRVGIAITFDDGYKDNLTYALPILEKYRIPATIYITTRFPEGNSNMWWYDLAEMCETKKEIVFKWRGKFYQWSLSSWEKKYRCFHEIHSLISDFSDNELNEFMTRIRQEKPSGEYAEYCLTWDEIRSLQQHSLITIGSHTHSHLKLSRLNDEEVRKEIEGSKLLLESHLETKVEHFSYPYGTTAAFGMREVLILNNCDFKTAVTARCDCITGDSNRLLLPRYGISNRDSIDHLNIKLSGLYLFFCKLAEKHKGPIKGLLDWYVNRVDA